MEKRRGSVHQLNKKISFAFRICSMHICYKTCSFSHTPRKLPSSFPTKHCVHVQPQDKEIVMATESLSKYITLVSADGFEFVVLREAAMISTVLKGMLDPRST
jgi:hypothetical protein